jgi:hypothetical protein
MSKLKKTNLTSVGRSNKDAAIVALYDATSDPLCPTVRIDVDAVLSSATDNGITSITSNNDWLTDYMPPDDVPAIYNLLNRKLSKYPGFKLIKSTEITKGSSVGEVRKTAYDHCNLTCSHI